MKGPGILIFITVDAVTLSIGKVKLNTDSKERWPKRFCFRKKDETCTVIYIIFRKMATFFQDKKKEKAKNDWSIKFESKHLRFIGFMPFWCHNHSNF